MSNATEAAISNNVLFLKLRVRSIGIWRKGDIAEVETSAKKNCVRLSKKTIECEELHALLAVPRDLKRWLEFKTLPCPYADSLYMVPIKDVTEVDTHLKQAKELYREKLNTFLGVYDTAIEEARVNLGEQFDVADYQTKEALSSRIKLEWEYVSIGKTPESLSAVSAEIYEEQRSKYELMFKELYDHTRNFLREELLTLTENLLGQLGSGQDGKRTRLTTKSFNAVSEFLDNFTGRNITTDTELEELVNKTKQIMSGAEIQLLQGKESAYKAAIRSNLNQVVETLKAPEFIQDANARVYTWD